MCRTKAENSQTFVASADEGVAAILRSCLSRACFWEPEQLGPQLAWLEHAPFAFWLMEGLRPRTLVELGTHGGFSYFVFCQAVKRLQLETRCYAVDTWKGDEHAGYYGEEVYQQVCSYHDRHYSAFSALIRSTFDEALSHFSDGTIDLLHIDGRHFYEDVRHDFESWRPKLSDRSIVLIHDTNVRAADFGVFRVWEQLNASHPNFEFLHGHGLGVLGVGTNIPDEVRALFTAARDQEATTCIRAAYSRLGSAVSRELLSEKQNAELTQRTAEAQELARELAAVKEAAVSRELLAEKQNAELTQCTAEAQELARELATIKEAADDANVALQSMLEVRNELTLERNLLQDDAASLKTELAQNNAENEALRSELARRAQQTAENEELQARLWQENQALAERERKLASLNQALAERDDKLASVNRALAERDDKLASLNQALAERDDKLASLNQALAERDDKLASVNRALAERDGKLASLNQGLAEREGKLASLNQALAEREGKLASVNHALVKRDDKLTSVNQELAELNFKIARLTSSHSWRLTRPLRFFGRLLKGKLKTAIEGGE